MPLDIAAYDNVLKNDYEKTVIQLLNPKVKTLKMFSKETGTWEGRRVEYPLNLSRNQGTMFTSENGLLPSAGAQGYASLQIPIRYCHGRIQLSIQVIKASRSSKGAFKRAMDQEMRGLIRDLATDRNRVMFGWGAGTLALVNDATPSGSATVGIDSPMGIAGSVNGTRFLQPGQIIAFLNPTGPAMRTDPVRTVVSITDGNTVVLNAAPDASVADDDLIVRAATTGTTLLTDTAATREAMGLLGLVDDGTFVTTLHNVSRTTYPIFQSYVLPSVGALSSDVIQRAIDVADQKGEGEIGYLICHHSVRRAYLALVEADRRYIGASLNKPDIGTVAAKLGDVTYGEIPMIVDKDAPYGTLFGVDHSTFTRWVEVEGEWADDDGTVLLRLQNQDAYEARYRIFDNFSVDRPAGCFRLDGITATVVAIHVD